MVPIIWHPASSLLFQLMKITLGIACSAFGAAKDECGRSATDPLRTFSFSFRPPCPPHITRWRRSRSLPSWCVSWRRPSTPSSSTCPRRWSPWCGPRWGRGPPRLALCSMQPAPLLMPVCRVGDCGVAEGLGCPPSGYMRMRRSAPDSPAEPVRLSQQWVSLILLCYRRWPGDCWRCPVGDPPESVTRA